MNWLKIRNSLMMVLAIVLTFDVSQKLGHAPYNATLGLVTSSLVVAMAVTSRLATRQNRAKDTSEREN